MQDAYSYEQNDAKFRRCPRSDGHGRLGSIVEVEYERDQARCETFTFFKTFGVKFYGKNKLNSVPYHFLL